MQEMSPRITVMENSNAARRVRSDRLRASIAKGGRIV